MNRLYLWLQHHPTVGDVIIATPIGLLALLFTGPASRTHDGPTSRYNWP